MLWLLLFCPVCTGNCPAEKHTRSVLNPNLRTLESTISCSSTSSTLLGDLPLCRYHTAAPGHVSDPPRTFILPSSREALWYLAVLAESCEWRIVSTNHLLLVSVHFAAPFLFLHTSQAATTAVWACNAHLCFQATGTDLPGGNFLWHWVAWRKSRACKESLPLLPDCQLPCCNHALSFILSQLEMLTDHDSTFS